MTNEEKYDFVGQMDPVELFHPSNDLVKSNLNSEQCTALSVSEALSAYYNDPGVSVLQKLRENIRLHSRAYEGYATEQYVKVLARRVEVRDQNPEDLEMG